MTMKRFLFDIPLIDLFLPMNLKPAPDEVFADKASFELIKETESILDKLIEQGNRYKGDRTIQKNEHEYAIEIKLLRKQIQMQLQDRYHSRARFKKRIEIVFLRKTKKSTPDTIRTATVHYVKNNRTYVASLKETALFLTIYQKLDELDDILSGKKIKVEQKKEPPLALEDNKHERELIEILHEAKRQFQRFNTLLHEPLIESRLCQITNEAEKLAPSFSFLQIEDRYNVKRMFREDIPKLLETYKSLSSQTRQAHTENVFISLSKMELLLIRYQEQVEKEKILKMEQLLKLNELRYAYDQKKRKRT